MSDKYEITVGEVGNEIGHVKTVTCADDAAAIRSAKREAKPYGGDGWWIVKAEGQTVDQGGRKSM